LKKCRSISKQLDSGSTVAAQLLNLVSIVDCGREKKRGRESCCNPIKLEFFCRQLHR